MLSLIASAGYGLVIPSVPVSPPAMVRTAAAPVMPSVAVDNVFPSVMIAASDVGARSVVSSIDDELERMAAQQAAQQAAIAQRKAAMKEREAQIEAEAAAKVSSYDLWNHLLLLCFFLFPLVPHMRRKASVSSCLLWQAEKQAKIDAARAEAAAKAKAKAQAQAEAAKAKKTDTKSSSSKSSKYGEVVRVNKQAERSTYPTWEDSPASMCYAILCCHHPLPPPSFAATLCPLHLRRRCRSGSADPYVASVNTESEPRMHQSLSAKPASSRVAAVASRSHHSWAFRPSHHHPKAIGRSSRDVRPNGSIRKTHSRGARTVRGSGRRRLVRGEAEASWPLECERTMKRLSGRRLGAILGS